MSEIDTGRLQRAGANATAQGKNQSSSTETVTVGCKLPHGLILDLTVKGQAPRRFRIKGRNSAGIIGGYGITEGVPKDFWEAWLNKHRDMEFVKKELVFAYGKADSTRAAAAERDELKTGAEPIDPTKKGGLPAGIQTLVNDPA